METQDLKPKGGNIRRVAESIFKEAHKEGSSPTLKLVSALLGDEPAFSLSSHAQSSDIQQRYRDT